MVAPYTGAWIEITVGWEDGMNATVAPYTGAWIEMQVQKRYWQCYGVAPYTGAWIEILIVASKTVLSTCRTLHGCVD